MKRLFICLKLWLPPVLWMVVLYYLSSISNLRAVADPKGDELIRTVAHFLFYALGYLLFFRAFQTPGVRRRRNLTPGVDRLDYFLPLFFVLLYAFLDEVHQHFVPVRTFQLQDLLVDGSGAFLGLILLQEKRLVNLVNRL